MQMRLWDHTSPLETPSEDSASHNSVVALGSGYLRIRRGKEKETSLTIRELVVDVIGICAAQIIC